MARSQEKARDFLRTLGISTDSIGVEPLLDAFRTEMDAGLSGLPSSLAMIPTFIPVDRPVPAGVPVIVLDAGGTHLRAATVKQIQLKDDSGREINPPSNFLV